MPGPGNYNSEKNLGKTVAYSISGKGKHKYNENPGPGSYSQMDSVTKSKT
jgi:hypothetical protein